MEVGGNCSANTFVCGKRQAASGAATEEEREGRRSGQRHIMSEDLEALNRQRRIGNQSPVVKITVGGVGCMR